MKYMLVAIYEGGESDVLLMSANPAYIIGIAEQFFLRNVAKIEVWKTAQDPDTFTDAETIYSKNL